MAMWSDIYTDPANHREGERKDHLFKIWRDHGAEAVRAANAAFGTPGAAFDEPVKESTLTTWIWIWRRWRASQGMQKLASHEGWNGPIQMRNLLEKVSDPKTVLPPHQGSAYLVTRHAWQGQPTQASTPLYVGGVTGKSDRFRIRIGDLLADMFGFYGNRRNYGHHSGGRSLHEWATQNRVNLLDVHLAWVEGTDCHRCLEVRLYERLRPLLNRATPSRCTNPHGA